MAQVSAQALGVAGDLLATEPIVEPAPMPDALKATLVVLLASVVCASVFVTILGWLVQNFVWEAYYYRSPLRAAVMHGFAAVAIAVVGTVIIVQQDTDPIPRDFVVVLGVLSGAALGGLVLSWRRSY